jgi:hypothetical protein
MKKIIILFWALCLQMVQGMEKLPHEIQSLQEAARGNGEAVAMFELGKFYANEKENYKVAIGWFLAFGARSIQDASILKDGELKRVIDLKNIVGKLAAENAQLNNYYIDQQNQYEEEFNLRLNQIKIVTEEDKLESPNWMVEFLKNNEADKFIEQTQWKQKRLEALKNAPQLLLPGFKETH